MTNSSSQPAKRIPVILDTDIGTDIDDTWALVMLRNSPKLDLKLVVTESGDTTYRAKIVAKLLEIGQRTDVPLGIGLRLPDDPAPQAPWVEGYSLTDYPGTVYEDGVDAIINTIMNSPDPVTLLCIGPVPNIADALEREPRIAQRARFVGMHGSIRRGYNGRAEIDAEYNVKAYTEACQKAFAAEWDMTITPVDTCGLIRLAGERYQRVRSCRTPLAQALVENYQVWAASRVSHHRFDPTCESSVLFDTVAVYLTFAQDLLVMEDLGIRVTDDGYTMIDDQAKVVHCATEWKDIAAFEDLLVERLTRETEN